MCDCCKKKKVHFNPKPQVSSWTVQDAEVTLFEECIRVHCDSEATADVSIAAEIVNNDVISGVYNVYRLYINDKLVSNSGYEAVRNQFYGENPSLETSNLIWGGCARDHCSCDKNLRVRVTAQLTELSTPAPGASSNVSNTVGSFKGAKGAFLRVLLV